MISSKWRNQELLYVHYFLSCCSSIATKLTTMSSTHVCVSSNIIITALYHIKLHPSIAQEQSGADFAKLVTKLIPLLSNLINWRIYTIIVS